MSNGKHILDEFGVSEAQAKRIIRGRKAKPRVLNLHITDKTYTFGVVSDTHLCSVHEKLNELHTFYEICRKEGIKEVVHAGDIIAGWGIYRGQENEVHTFGAYKQAQYVVDHYPRVKGITTYFITGNHCLSWWQRAGIDPGFIISERRDDMVYLGQYSGEVRFGNVRVRLHHGAGGGAYALSYKAQKLVEQLQSGRKPHIFILGHYHSAIYFWYRNVHVFLPGCFEAQSLFMLRKGLNPAIGGWTIKLHTTNSKKTPVVAITPTWIPFF